ncbi:hypothetical protein [Stakelama tenebrarum]|uniref:DUF1761 domain-containing protein n=1 Tax=Stakelama tenebrarum TaxID=2711215 RepID=A0A6G6Y879_9SPHN|nr:hypothetical protein [Sphingosinithalassobacter tenebrarum]QIG81144.1 hypothetical protein G5C33_16085 [Sphingosinithalassobacter tenebrarum]
MPRLLLGGVVGGLAMWFVGFIFWGTPLSYLAFTVAPDAQGLAVQAALAENLGPTGTGAYPIPWPGTNAGTSAYGNGPTAMVLFNNNGFPVVDSSALIGGLVLAILCALVIAAALRSFTQGASFGTRMKLVALFAVAITVYVDLGQPIFNHAPWGYFLFAWVADLVSFLAAGAVISRWFMPRQLPGAD